ncbi:MAG: Fe(3+) ABC transporter substrate-binding protein [Alphaproteobacteria bacterium]|nr:Fe(3+) ABC transporter substrate-binding protein [Alphaproteobacteria bacterium]
MGLLLSVAGLLGSTAAAFASDVNIYSYRQEFLLRPILEKFTSETGVKVNVVYAKKGMLQRLEKEGENTLADVVITADIARLKALSDANLLGAVDSAVLKSNIPVQYRDSENRWFGLTLRSRIIAYAKDRVKPGEIKRYEDLADPKWKGRICVRSGSHIYNRALVASMIAAHGEAKAETWAKGVVANFARKPQGNDRAQAKAVYQGVCDIAIMNTYYFAKMALNEKKPEQQKWAAALTLMYPNQDDRGAHINISGAAVVRYAKHRADAIRLVEFMSGNIAQELYASKNYEFPVKKGVTRSDLVKSWGEFKADALGLSEIARLSPAAQKVVDRAGWK